MRYVLLSLIVIFLGATVVVLRNNPTKPLEAVVEPQNEPQSYCEVIEMTETARISCYTDRGIMASGKYVYPGAVATSDRSIPMGTEVYIEGFGIMTIEDRTALWVHEQRGFTIDIYDPNCTKNFGVKKLTYKIL